MSATETITLVIAALALAVSVFSLYRTYFHTSVDLVGTLASLNVPEPGDWVPAVFEFTLSNLGNRELLIRETSVDALPHREELIPEGETKELPLVLRPGEIRLIRIEVASHWLYELYEEGRQVRFEIEVIGPDASVRGIAKDISFTSTGLSVGEEAWSPFRMT